MPILNVEIVQRANESLSSELAQHIADAAGDVFGTPSGQTWVKVNMLSPNAYAENGGAPADVAPVIVSIIKGDLPDKAALESEVSELTECIDTICNRPQ